MIHRRRDLDRGFTLVEVLVAIVLVGILGAVAVVGVGALTDTGATAACQTSLDATRTAALVHLTSTRTQPTTFTEMVSSGSLDLPPAVTVDATGQRAVGPGWQLVLTPGTPVGLTCVAGTTAALSTLTTTAPVAAYSLRRVVSAYVGPVIQVRRSTDDAVLDIGVTTAGDLDTAALLAFSAGGDAYVTTWFDQSGNGYHATQPVAAKQPQVIAAGALVKQNGEPVVSFSSTTWLSTAAVTMVPTGYTVAIVAGVRANTAFPTPGAKTRANVPAPYDVYGSSYLVGNGGGYAARAVSPGFSASSGFSQWTYAGDATQVRAFRNGTSTLADTSAPGVYADSATPFFLGSRQDLVTQFDGWLAEYVILPVVLPTSERQAVERDEGIYFGIPVA